MPGVLSRLLPSIASAYLLQSALAAIFVPQANEKFYDLGGSLGFLSTSFLSLYYPSLKARFWDGLKDVSIPKFTDFAPRQVLISAAVGIWTVRLGSFLVTRAIKAGGDSRFDKVKHHPAQFTFFWMAQATWVLLVGLPIYLVNSLPSTLHPRLGLLDYVSVAALAGSLAFEVIADRQKAAWRKAKGNKEHEDKFIKTGLWSISRHPNYVGEIGIWSSIYVLSTTTLRSPYFPRWTWVGAAVSPLFTWFLLRKVSGVPLLEKAGDKKWAGDKEWEEYKRTVPVLFPWGPYE